LTSNGGFKFKAILGLREERERKRREREREREREKEKERKRDWGKGKYAISKARSLSLDWSVTSEGNPAEQYYALRCHHAPAAS